MSEEIADDQINIRVPTSFKQKLKDHCELMSDITIDYISCSRFLVEAANEKIERDLSNE